MVKVNIQEKKFHWTRHVQEKMRYYNLSESRLKRVFRYPKRREEGVAENTIACMQSAGSKKHVYEIWLMYQKRGNIVKIISAWRYPGVSPTDGKVPIPDDILEELNLERNLS